MRGTNTRKTQASGVLPIRRARRLSSTERLVREFVLQLKWGRIDVARFKEKFGEDVLSRLAEPLRDTETEGWLTTSESEVRLTRAGLLRVDRLLPRFYLEDATEIHARAIMWK